MIRPIIKPIGPIMPVRPVPLPCVKVDVFSAIIAPLLILAVFVLAVWLMLKMNEDKFKGVNKLASLISAAGIGLILLVLFGSTLAAVKGMILCMILMYASISDIWRREVPDYVWAMIAILAFVRFDASNLPSMIVGALVVFVPQLAVSVMRPSRAIGGADIKISTALAFLLGAEKGLCAMIIGLTAAVITMLIVRKVKKTGKGEAFPLVPFLAAGAMAVFMI